MPLGAADEQKPAGDGTVEAWARAADNPVRGWYGLKKGLRGRFAVYVPPGARDARAGRGRAQPAQQPDAGRRLVTRHGTSGGYSLPPRWRSLHHREPHDPGVSLERVRNAPSLTAMDTATTTSGANMTGSSTQGIETVLHPVLGLFQDR